jgi:hypothetical protein
MTENLPSDPYLPPGVSLNYIDPPEENLFDQRAMEKEADMQIKQRREETVAEREIENG